MLEAWWHFDNRFCIPHAPANPMRAHTDPLQLARVERRPQTKRSWRGSRYILSSCNYIRTHYFQQTRTTERQSSYIPSYITMTPLNGWLCKTVRTLMLKFAHFFVLHFTSVTNNKLNIFMRHTNTKASIAEISIIKNFTYQCHFIILHQLIVVSILYNYVLCYFD